MIGVNIVTKLQSNAILKVERVTLLNLRCNGMDRIEDDKQKL